MRSRHQYKTILKKSVVWKFDILDLSFVVFREYRGGGRNKPMSELGRKIWKSFIQSAFLHCRLVQTKTPFLLELTRQEWSSITHKSNMKTTRPLFVYFYWQQWKIQSNTNAGHCGLKYPNARVSILPRGSGQSSGRFPEFRRLCGRLPHKTGGLAGMCG